MGPWLPVRPMGPWAPVAPVVPWAPVRPVGILKLRTAAVLVPLFVTEALEPAAPVVVVPTAIVLIGNVTAVVPVPKLSCWPLKVNTSSGRDSSLPAPSTTTLPVALFASFKRGSVRLPPRLPLPSILKFAEFCRDVPLLM